MTLPTENIGFDLLLTLGGLVLAVYILTTVVRQVWTAAPVKIVGLAISVLLSAAVLVVQGDYSGQALTTAVVNAGLAFLLFLSAAGFSLTVDGIASRRGAAVRSLGAKPAFWEHW